MKSQKLKSSLFVRKGGELPLSGPALVELLRAVLDKGKPFRFRAKGFSMSPFVMDGDVITISPLGGVAPHLGEIAAYACAETGRLIVHRVAGKRGNSYLIMGDNNPEEHDLAPEANLLGRVTRVERNGRDVCLGLGPERLIIALLHRHRLSWKMAHLLGRMMRHLCGWRQGLT